MRIPLVVLTAILLASPAVAGSFFLIDHEQDAVAGPFEYKDGTRLRLNDREFSLKISEGPIMPSETAAKAIVIPNIEFREAHISDIVQFLREASIACCPEGTNVNLVVQVSDTNTVGRGASRRVTLTMRNISLYDTLKYATEPLGLTIRFDERAIVITESESNQRESRFDPSSESP